MAYAWLVGGGFAKCPYNYISLIYPHGLWTTPNLEWMGSISSWHTFAIVRERRGIGGTKRGHLQSGLFIFWQGSRNSCWWKKHFLLNEPLDNHIPSGISQVTTESNHFHTRYTYMYTVVNFLMNVKHLAYFMAIFYKSMEKTNTMYISNLLQCLPTKVCR